MFEPAQEALRIANYDLLISDFDTAMASDNLLALIKSTRSTRPDVAILAC